MAVFILLLFGSQTPEYVAAGRWVRELFVNGQWWRAVTAATLHADAEHALGNAGFILVVAWAASERVGPGLAVASWLATAVAGFYASLLGDIHLSVGASGGLFGLLGVAGARAVRDPLPQVWIGKRRYKSFSAAVLLLALWAVGPRSNVHAHIGGFVGGAIIGFALPIRIPRWAQAVAGIATVLILVGSWALALT
jgi:membrane associated rhomboid family serine protease